VPEGPENRNQAERGCNLQAYSNVTVGRPHAPLSPLQLKQDVADHEGAKNSPEQEVIPGEQEAAREPKVLIGVQSPGGDKHGQHGHYVRRPLAPTPKPEVRRVMYDLHHEIFPIDIYPSPEVGDAAGE
jgi:hypothetical protein